MYFFVICQQTSTTLILPNAGTCAGAAPPPADQFQSPLVRAWGWGGGPASPAEAGGIGEKGRPCHFHSGGGGGKVRGTRDPPPAGLEEPLLKARERPVLDGDGNTSR